MSSTRGPVTFICSAASREDGEGGGEVTEDKLRYFQKLFYKLDPDGNGKVTHDEARLFLGFSWDANDAGPTRE